MNISQKTFPNGLSVIVSSIKDSPSVTMGVFVKTGSAYETKEQNGISHVLEHLCFKGTSKRPRPRDITEELEGMGAQYNAFTSRDMTGYYAKVAPRFFSKAFDVIADIYLNSTFPEHELEKEKGVIIEEMRMYEDLPRWKVGELMEQQLYGDQPAGWTIIGPEKTVQRITRDDIVAYKEKHYIPHNTVIVVAGPLRAQDVFKQVKRYFAHISTKKRTEPAKVKPHVPGKHMEYRKLDQTHFSLGFQTVPLTHKDRIPLILLANILGGGMASRLFQVVREDKGAAYYIAAGNDFFATHGYLKIFGGLNHKKSDEVYALIAQELKKIKKEGVSFEELKRVRDYTAGTFLLSVESSSDIAFFLGEQACAHKDIRKPRDIVKEIYTYHEKDIVRMARKYLKKEKLAVAAIGPRKEDAKKVFKAFNTI